MKLYIFMLDDRNEYKNDDSLDVSSIDNKNHIYAFTSDKTIRNEFISTRNMKYFKEIKVDLSDDKYMEFVTDNKNLELKYIKLHTKKEHKGKFRVSEFEILTNESEIDTVDMYSYTHIFNKINEIIDFETLNLIKKKVLKKDITSVLYKYFYFKEVGENFLTDDAIEYNDKLDIDMLGVYLMLYKDSYKL